MNKSNEFLTYAGIDVSKNHLDIAVLDTKQAVLLEFRFDNTKQGWKECLARIKKAKIDVKKTLFCLEKTGRYSNICCEFLYEKELFVWLEMPIKIKQSRGFARGKSDKVDAIRIAEYACTFRFKAVCWQAPRDVIQKIKNLFLFRQKLSKAKNQFQSPMTDLKFLSDKESKKLIKEQSKQIIEQIKKKIVCIEEQIMSIINADPTLSRKYKLAVSVDGVGFMTAVSMIVYSNEFNDIITAKQYACYAGIAPFENSSGKSIHAANRVSHFANKDAKRILHLAAMSAIVYKNEYKDFYENKISQGKPKMLVLNIIRNKIVSRVYSCINNDRLYTKNFERVFLKTD